MNKRQINKRNKRVSSIVDSLREDHIGEFLSELIIIYPKSKRFAIFENEKENVRNILKNISLKTGKKLS